MSDKKRYPHAEALAVANEIIRDMRGEFVRMVYAGSLRREKPDVGDIEIVYVPKMVPGRLRAHEWFQEVQSFRPRSDAVELKLHDWIVGDRIIKRLNSNLDETWGPQIKLATDVRSGIPVDFFKTSMECWSNYLVCRTGGKESNRQIAMAARRKGWKWHPYSEGFSDDKGRVLAVSSEEEVFRAVGLPYLEPKNRL